MKRFILVLCCFVLGLQVIFADTPTDVTISVIGTNINISWSDSTNADMFYIYRSTYPDSGFVKIDSVNVTTYIDSGAVTGNKYFYYVTAIVTVTDIDGNIYQTVQIGNQIWMAENLKVTHYRNGDTIPNLTNNGDWLNTTSGAYCVYNNIPANADTYGNLYNWYALADTRNIAPEGWHVPTDEEIKELEMALGMSQAQADAINWRGTNEGSKLAGNSDLWNNGNLENNAEFGTSGYNILPGGYREMFGSYQLMSNYCYIWSLTVDGVSVWSRTLYYNLASIARATNGKCYGFSVRCVRD